MKFVNGAINQQQRMPYMPYIYISWNSKNFIFVFVYFVLVRSTLGNIIVQIPEQYSFQTSQELRMLSLSLFIQGSLWMMRLLFSIARNVISVSQISRIQGVFSMSLSSLLSFSSLSSLSLLSSRSSISLLSSLSSLSPLKFQIFF